LNVTKSQVTWPLLRTVGLYMGACWVAVEFADWLVGRYALPDRLVDITLIGLLSFTPAVALLAYFHGAPGRQKAHPVEKIAIPVNAVVSAALITALFYLPRPDSVTTGTATGSDPVSEQLTRAIVQSSQRRGVSLFFFDNRTGDDSLDWLQYGLTLALSADLSQHPFVKVWTPYSGFSTYGLFHLRKAGYADGLDVPVALMRNIASDGKMEYFLTGTISAGEAPGSVAVTTTLYETATARAVDSVTRISSLDAGLLESIDSTTSALLADLALPTPTEQTADLPVAERLTNSLTALEAHTRAMNARRLDTDTDAALTLWKQAVAEDPSFAVAQIAMGRMLLDSGQMIDGGMAIREALRHDYKLIDRERFIAKGMNYVFAGDRDKELETYRTWTELVPDDPLAFAYLGTTALYAANDPITALAAYERIYELDPREDWTLAKIAYLHEVLDNREAAIEYYTRYLEARPGDPSPLISLGELHRREGDLSAARQFFERAAIIASGLVDPTLNLADLDLREGRYDDALARLDEAEAIAAAPSQYAAVLRARLAWHAQRGQEQQLITLLPQLGQLVEQYLPPIDTMMAVWIEYIEHYVRAQRVEEGIEILRGFEQKLQPPLSSLVDVGYLRMSLAMRDPDAAEAHGEVAAELIETMDLLFLEYQVAYGEGVILGLRGDRQGAIEALERALALYDKSIDSLDQESIRLDIMIELADQYRLDDQQDRALATLRGVLSVYPAHVAANLAMAELLHQQGNADEAAKFLATVSHALAVADPNYPLLLAARELDASLGI
jgi:tetratricopeptide (TPR) repeat protein